jgi:hypothetical protein
MFLLTTADESPQYGFRFAVSPMPSASVCATSEVGVDSEVVKKEEEKEVGEASRCIMHQHHQFITGAP